MIPGIKHRASRGGCILLIALAVSLAGSGKAACQDDGEKLAYIAKWYNNRKAAVSLRFDDNLQSHVKTAIPILNRYGIKATFMVSPGRASFIRNEEFWKSLVPAMGHELGNHTMHHRGAEDLEEARYEIGEADSIIRSLYPPGQGMLVFASGGNKMWAGRHWEEADESITSIPASFNLIDLYDGYHTALGADSASPPEELLEYIVKAIDKTEHQPISFHQVGFPRLRDLARRILKGRGLYFSKREFVAFLDMMSSREKDLWIAPLGDVLKYEAQYHASFIEDHRTGDGEIAFHLNVGTDPKLYNQALTVMVPGGNDAACSAVQDNDPVTAVRVDDGSLMLTLAPRSSSITVTCTRTPVR